jgi:hypothetical protein
MLVAEAVGRALADHGVRTAFGVVGSGNFHATNALIAAGVRFVPAAHEGGAATMADAYARTAGEPAVLSVHQGPGVTNALTGITEAAKSRTPLIVIAPEATAARSNFFIDLPACAASVGAELPGRCRGTPGGHPGAWRDGGVGSTAGRADQAGPGVPELWRGRITRTRAAGTGAAGR